MSLFLVPVVCIPIILAIWGFYNAPILLVGVRKKTKEQSKTNQAPLTRELPLVSIIVPVKDEEKVIGRLLEALLHISYPSEKMEIIIVEDGSTDRTEEICRNYAERFPELIRLVNQPVSRGKPSALNFGFQHAKGQIIGVFDADSVPEKNAVLNAVKHFDDYSTAVVQGRNLSLNANYCSLSRISSYEETLAFQLHLEGRDTLNMFVPLTGSCYFIRKSAVEQAGGWDVTALTEDLEMSVRLSLQGHRIKYASNVKAHHESVTEVKQFITQRLRWFRGSMEVGLKFGKLLAKPNRKNIDIELTLLGPFIFPICLLGLITVLLGFLFPVEPNPITETLFMLSSVLSLIVVLTSVFVIAFAAYKQEQDSFLWLPFIYFFWIFEAFLATCAFFQIVLRRPREWTKIRKTGVVSN